MTLALLLFLAALLCLVIGASIREPQPKEILRSQIFAPLPNGGDIVAQIKAEDPDAAESALSLVAASIQTPVISPDLMHQVRGAIAPAQLLRLHFDLPKKVLPQPRRRDKVIEELQERIGAAGELAKLTTSIEVPDIQIRGRSLRVKTVDYIEETIGNLLDGPDEL